MNFSFLTQIPEYEMFASACVDAEQTFASSPTICALACRKAMELAVKWVYAADSTMTEPWRDNLASLIHEPSFKNAMDSTTWGQLRFIWKLGNVAAHTKAATRPQDAVLALRGLFNFVEWIDYCYGPGYEARRFDAKAIPAVKHAIDERKLREQQEESHEKDARIAELEEQVRALREQYATSKQERPAANFEPDELTEYEARERYIDLDLEYAGWNLEKSVRKEVEVSGRGGSGRADYVLLGRDGRPLAIVEAKRPSLDPRAGEAQARLYADCLEERYGNRPFVFLSNGFETWFMDDGNAPLRRCSGIFGRDDLERLMNRRGHVSRLTDMSVNLAIAGGGRNRYYQAEAIEAVCQNMQEGNRRSLLVMATGTGKTRTAVALVDVLTRANAVTNVLFLADRLELVRQAKGSFQKYLPSSTACNLCNSSDRQRNTDARLVFSTYPTILNAIDDVQGNDGGRLFTPAHFDLIIVDEAHRSIFKKYRAIFDYFDAPLVGLTATPKNEVDRNTYDFFDVERGQPTFLYEYDTAVNRDHVLVPYHTIATKTVFLSEGITYDDLSEEDRERYDDDWEEVRGTMAPAFVPSSDVNRHVFNEGTIELVLERLMADGIRVKGGESIGKTIVFAQSQRHARLIEDRFNHLWPQLGAKGFCQCVTCDDRHSSQVIKDFKSKEMPVIAVSVDMLDTGIDVPEVVNLVFFKQVRSKVKFWQMLGRGTRLREGLAVQDRSGSHDSKQCFYVFDWCGNFDFFNQEKDQAEGKMPPSLSERVFTRQAELVKAFQGVEYDSEEYHRWRTQIVGQMTQAVDGLRHPLTGESKLHLREIERFSQESGYQDLTDADVADLGKVAPLVHYDSGDDCALAFDALMYSFMLAKVSGEDTIRYRDQVVGRATRLQAKASIPQVRGKMPLLKSVCADGALDGAAPLKLDTLRSDLRDLMRFLRDQRLNPVTTDIADKVIGSHDSDVVGHVDDYTDYKLRVNRYLERNADKTVIAKLRGNVPMTQFEFEELGRIFTQELGSVDDYRSSYGDMPFGRLVRTISGLDHEAATAAFAEFLSDESLTRDQMDFVHKVVDYVERNGYMDPTSLSHPPFDRPRKFSRLFDGEKRRNLIRLIKSVDDNADKPAA